MPSQLREAIDDLVRDLTWAPDPGLTKVVIIERIEELAMLDDGEIAELRFELAGAQNEVDDLENRIDDQRVDIERLEKENLRLQVALRQLRVKAPAQLAQGSTDVQHHP